MFTVLTTPTGSKLHVSVSLSWEFGAALYRVAEIDGTITLGWDAHHYGRDCCAGDALHVCYGRPTGNPFAVRFEDAPTVFGVRLAASAVFHPADMHPERCRWLVVRRDNGDPYAAPDAPAGTRKRTAGMVFTLAGHFLTQHWTGALRRAHDYHHARYRLAEHTSALLRLEAEINRLNTDLATELAGQQHQRAILAAGPVQPPERRADEPPVPPSAVAT